MTALAERSRVFSRSDLIFLGLAVVTTVGAVVVRSGSVLPFVVSAAAVAVLAALVGRAVDHLADRLGAGAVGVLQSALGNLPELFISIFALRAGLTTVVTSAIIGSILANLLLVLGLSFTVGSARHGVLRFSEQRARLIMGLMILSVASMLIPSLASYIHSPAAGHEVALSRITAIVLLTVFALSIPASLRREAEPRAAEQSAEASEEEGGGNHWPLWLAVGMLAVTGLAAAYVSDLFVDALTPAMNSLHISQAFSGLVIVAIAGNAVENAVGVKLAWQNQADHALSVVLNSPLQIALVLAPALVLLSPVIGGPAFTLVFNPMLVTTVGIATLAVLYLISDGESDWLEGSAMIGLYVLVATAFWWG
ncbi:sodium/calcium exchanger membrane region [Catenulispora acidiphila DSM 44928]|uniref:Ca(2+)/H(+) antiporter n=1 Tax=Catenulispora acidiphila (strain DSM 44928 / JCM 14897 / NBRC 102108 / NRRL B-24433 / ID139908) TaxID=479433 RepID=C7Q777_CATAD|nr:calcium/proton exchanger [Catenulispora acidiphila]ACU70165.1 sodium/calcium exchanger membrane region [Catenulispora acidiphila DSM 44928]